MKRPESEVVAVHRMRRMAKDPWRDHLARPFDRPLAQLPGLTGHSTRPHAIDRKTLPCKDKYYLTEIEKPSYE